MSPPDEGDFSLFSVICLIIEIKPASLTGYLSDVVAVRIHFVVTCGDHPTIDVAYRIDDNVRMIFIFLMTETMIQS